MNRRRGARGLPPRGLGRPLGEGHGRRRGARPDRLYKAPTDYTKTLKDFTKARQTIHSPDRHYKAPERLYKASTDYTKPKQDYTKTMEKYTNPTLVDKKHYIEQEQQQTSI